MIQARFPNNVRVEKVSSCPKGITELQTLHFHEEAFVPQYEIGGLLLDGLGQYMALERAWFFWVRPVFGQHNVTPSGDANPDEMLFFMGTDDQHSEHMLILPLMAGDWRATLRPGGEKGFYLGIHGGSSNSLAHPEAPLFLMAKGNDPNSLIEGAMNYLSQRLGTFKLTQHKRTPEFVDWFGWCTWDAFYDKVSAEKVIQGLQSFKDLNLQPKFMILDDGWLDVDALGRLKRFKANEKFPNDLKEVTARAKSEYGIKIFGLWHALQGYWGGVSPDDELGKRYKVKSRMGRKAAGMQTSKIGLVCKEDIYRFYQDFYLHLHQEGIDMVKVDSQSGMHEISGPGYGSIMQAYQYAMQGAAQTHFEGNLLHCMSNTQEVAYHMSSSVAWRNSDDFYPNKPESHTRHLVYNAFNALWSKHFSIPDWDMFKSGHETGAYHGAARAISGGPIYVSDGPGEQNAKLIQKLILADGRSLRSTQAATVVSSRIYRNPSCGDGLLLIQNQNGPSAVLGTFNADQEGKIVDDVVSLKELGLQQGPYVCYRPQSSQLEILKASASITLKQGKLEFELFHFTPLQKGVAPLGFLDKYNASAAIVDAHWSGTTYICELLCGGNIGFYCNQSPSDVVDKHGKSIAFKYDPSTGLLRLKSKSSSPLLLQLIFE